MTSSARIARAGAVPVTRACEAAGITRRDDLYLAYWRFASERQQIFHRRLAGEKPPWTSDPILTRYKFTNSYRASDRVSQFLIRDVIYSDGDFSSDDTLLRVILFRLFSRTTTWRALEAQLGPIQRKTLSRPRLASTLARLSEAGPIYTNAFILCANRAYGHERKYMNHLALLRAMFRRHALPRAVARVTSLAQLYDELLRYPLIGTFMAYQLAIDINYSELVDFDENEFTFPGPGAIRGIQKVFPHLPSSDQRQLIHWMVDHQVDESTRLGIEAPSLFGRRLHAIDCQNIFCEVDKYARVAFPEVQSNRTRIKTRFTPSSEPLRLFYPPKWQLNDRLPAPSGDPHAAATNDT